MLVDGRQCHFQNRPFIKLRWYDIWCMITITYGPYYSEGMRNGGMIVAPPFDLIGEGAVGVIRLIPPRPLALAGIDRQIHRR